MPVQFSIFAVVCVLFAIISAQSADQGLLDETVLVWYALGVLSIMVGMALKRKGSNK